MGDLRRRTFLRSVGVASLAVAGHGIPTGRPVAARRRSQGDPVVALSRRLRDCARADSLGIAANAIRAGTSARDLQIAVFLAGIQEIQPRPVGFKLHAVLVVESVFQLMDWGPPEDSLYPVLYNLDDVKVCESRDVDEGDWRLPPAPKPRVGGGAALLRQALAGDDDRAADEAVVGALESLAPAELFEVLWPVAASDFSPLGHKIIFAAHMHRILSRIGWKYSRPVLRSLVFGLRDRPQEGVEDVDSGLRAAANLPPGWSEGAADPRRSLALARDLERGDGAAARAAVVALLESGAGAATAWDAIRLAAAHQFSRAPGLLPVHPTTVANALFYAFRTTRIERTRRLALMQAASWLSRFRAVLERRVSMAAHGLLDQESPFGPADSKATVEELMRGPDPRTAARVLAAPDPVPALARALRRHLDRATREHHQPKYAAVVLEDLGLCHPTLRPYLGAYATEYLPTSSAPEHEMFAAWREVVERAPR